MPLYRFHVRTDVDEPDCEGTMLADPSEAKSEALRLIGRIICDAGIGPGRQDGWNVTVTDKDDLTLFDVDCVVTVSAATIAG